MRHFIITLFLLSISQLKSQSTLDWVYVVGSPNSHVELVTTAIDNNDNSIVIGKFSTTIDLDPGPNLLQLSPNSASRSFFLLKLDTLGDPIWVYQINDVFIEDLETDDLGNIFMSGYFRKTVDFDLDTSNQDRTPLSKSGDSFVVSYDENGKFRWVNQYNAPSISHQIEINSNGEFYWTGIFEQDTMDFDPDTGKFEIGSIDASLFINKMDSSGKFLWAKSIDGLLPSFQPNPPVAFRIDSLDNIYLSTNFLDSIDVDLDTTTKQFFSRNPYSPSSFISKYNSSGSLLWAHAITGYVSPNYNETIAINTDDSLNLYMSGTFADSIDFVVDSNTLIRIKSNHFPSRGGSGTANGYITKIDKYGKIKWAKNVGGGSYHWFEALDSKVDYDNNFQTLGYYRKDVGFYNMVLTKYDSSGIIISSDSIARSISYFPPANGKNKLQIDSKSNAYVSGGFIGTIDYDPGTSHSPDTSLNYEKSFIVKLNAKPLTTNLVKIQEKSKDYLIFPNPTKNWFYIEGVDKEAVDIIIYNMKGQMVRRLTNHQGIIDESLEKGIYLITIVERDGERSTIKLIVNQ